MRFFGEIVDETSIDVGQPGKQSEFLLVSGGLSLPKVFNVRRVSRRPSGPHLVAEVRNHAFGKMSLVDLERDIGDCEG